jgi:hypothetical protein
MENDKSSNEWKWMDGIEVKGSTRCRSFKEKGLL